MKKLFLLLGIVCTVSACKAETIDYKAMASSQEQFNERLTEERVAFMSLETMFPEPKVRALAKAAGSGKLSKVDQLIDEGVDINSQGTQGATPLFWAMRDIDGFRKLLELGADPNIVFDGSSVVHWAARNKDIKFLQAALTHGADPNLVAGDFRETPIFKTIGVKGSDNESAMNMLLDSGANINARTGGEKLFGMVSMGGRTPVMSAADLARFDIVYKLLIRGADYSLVDDSGHDLMTRVDSMRGRFKPESTQARDLERVSEIIAGQP